MIRPASSSSFEKWWRKVEEAGFCANPVHLTGGDGSGPEHEVFTRCNNRRAIVCPSCSDLYARDTWQLIHAGLRGGHHDIPNTVVEHPQVFVTLTAPGFGTVHTIRTTGSCHPPGIHRGQCPHRSPRWCEAAHDHDDPAPSGRTRPTSSGSRCVMSATTTSDTCCSHGTLQNSGDALRFSFGAF